MLHFQYHTGKYTLLSLLRWALSIKSTTGITVCRLPAAFRGSCSFPTSDYTRPLYLPIPARRRARSPLAANHLAAVPEVHRTTRRAPTVDASAQLRDAARTRLLEWGKGPAMPPPSPGSLHRPRGRARRYTGPPRSSRAPAPFWGLPEAGPGCWAPPDG